MTICGSEHKKHNTVTRRSWLERLDSWDELQRKPGTENGLRSRIENGTRLGLTAWPSSESGAVPEVKSELKLGLKLIARQIDVKDQGKHYISTDWRELYGYAI
ncbi:hypothetical protein EVAR_45538_1 [Eumeta japonica]|uniref:Uncharacterized protein n=1 Tax=Eumeta variegata TaxID=151549 RepID=A0A4C1X6E5_EUMVA|nr:hypothetical protein EVAR_45538_1 [Eumeta japonica]